MSTTPAGRSRSKFFLVVAGVALVLLGCLFFFFGPELYVAKELSAARRELREGGTEAALQRVRSLGDRYPHRGDVTFWLAVIQRRFDQFSAAEASLTEAELAGYDPEQIVLQRALIRCRTGGFDQAESVLRDALVRGVDDDTAADVYEAMASGFIVNYRLKDAWECLDYWIAWQPRSIKPYLLRAAISMQVPNRDEALEDFRTVVDIDPQHAEGRLKLAQCLLELNRGADALEEFRKGLELHPDNLEFRIGVANAQRTLGQFDEAKQTLDELLKERLSKPLRAQVLRLAGEAEFDRGEYEQAIRLFESAVRLAPREPLVHRGLFRAASLAGDKELAKRHQAIYDKLDADTKRLKEVTEKIIVEPRRVESRHEAGVILARNEFYDEAIGWWLSVLRIDPQHRPTHRALAEVYARQGKSNLAEFHRRAGEQAGSAAQSPATSQTDGTKAAGGDAPQVRGAADGPRS